MSRASDLRDAIVSELQTLLGESQPVDAFILPRYEREDLRSGPRVAVRVGARLPETGQANNQTSVVIQVGVVGIGPDATTLSSGQTYAAAELAKIDQYDTLMEQLIGYWQGGAMDGGIAEHHPREISQTFLFDSEKLQNEMIYLSLFEITYRDSVE